MEKSVIVLLALCLVFTSSTLIAQDYLTENVNTIRLEDDNDDNDPRRDPPFEEWFHHDDQRPGGAYSGPRNYWTRVTFTAEQDMDLFMIRFMPYNPGRNGAPCYVYLWREDAEHNLDERYIWAVRIDVLPPWDAEDESRNWIDLLIDERGLRFEQGSNFSVIYGPAPGVGDWQEPREDEGWWSLYDSENNAGRSFITERLYPEFEAWTDEGVQGDFLIGLGMNYISDNNPPEWTDVPEAVPGNEGDRVAFSVRGTDPDEADIENLVVTYNSDDIPENAVFEDAGGGRGSFSWQTGGEDAGDYGAIFTLSDGEDSVSVNVHIRIYDVNQPPVFVNNPPQNIEIVEGESVAFWMYAEDPDGDNLQMWYYSETLPREAFLYYGGGRGLFSWRPTYEDAGVYSAIFYVNDGAFEVNHEVSITVNESNHAPVWIDYPRDRQVTGDPGDEIVMYLTAADEDEDELNFRWEYAEEPPAEPEFDFALGGGGRIRFILYPERGQSGEYIVRFTASDGRDSTSIDILVNVTGNYFNPIPTGLAHSVGLYRITFFGQDMLGEIGEADRLDEIGVLTPGSVVAGAFRLEDYNPQERAVVIAYGDDRYTEPVEGFRQDEAFNFVYWDSDADIEYQVRGTVLAGDRSWRWDGYSVFELFVGPELEADAEGYDFGEVQTGDAVEWQVTFRSTGTTPVEDLRFVAEGPGFSVDPEGPLTVNPGEGQVVTVTFTPQEAGESAGFLTASNDYVSVRLDVRGIGVQTAHFEYVTTRSYHVIGVVSANLNGGPLENDDEIGVFTPGGLCCGSAIVANDERWEFHAWGDDEGTEETDGFREGEFISFRLWDYSANQEIEAVAAFIQGTNRWTERAYSYVTLSTVDRHFDWVQTEAMHRLMVHTYLRTGDEIAVITPRGTVAGGILIDEPGDTWEFIAFGDNPETEDVIEGFLENEYIYFRVWLDARETEYFARAAWEGPSRFTSGERSTVEIRLYEENRVPAWRPMEPVYGRAGERIEFAVIATDPERDPISLRLQLDELPEGVAFMDRGDGAGIFTWTPQRDQGGRYTARFFAFDGWDATEFRVSITVENDNRAPVLAAIGAIEIAEGEQFSLILAAEDPDGDRLRFVAYNMPYGASLEENLFRWTPNRDQAGEYEVTFWVIDYGQPTRYDTEVVTITVSDSNNPPEWYEVRPISSYEGARVLFEMRAIDLDDRNILLREGNLRLSAGNMPEGAQFTDRGSGYGIFDWQTRLNSAGEYHPYFIADDGQARDTMVVDITILNRNQPPVLAYIGDRTVPVNQRFELAISAEDVDPGDQAELTLIADNLPQGAQFTDQGEGVGLLVWEPRFDGRGIYSDVRFIAIDPQGARDEESVLFTVRLEDETPPVISEVSPGEGEAVRNNQPTITALISDELSGVVGVDFIFDNERYQFHYDSESGEFSWQPEEALSEGYHRWAIRAWDYYRNVTVFASYFLVNGEAGVIEPHPLPPYTSRDRIPIYGTAEPGLTIELWRDGERLATTNADERGNFRFLDVLLNEELNEFTLMGGDRDGNLADPADISIYFDIEPPVVEFLSPDLAINDNTPEIVAVVVDAGIGMGDGDIQDRMRGGIELYIDRERVERFTFENDTLRYQVEQALSDGGHFAAIAASDLLGNTNEDPVYTRFFVDTRPPLAEHRLLGGEIDTISNRNPVLIIPVSDPRPSSGIDPDSFVLYHVWERGEERLDFEWNPREGSLYYSWRDRDPIDMGRHELTLTVNDMAGNRYSSRGGFIVAERRDREPPYFENLNPSPNCVAGRGAREVEGGGESADTVRFVFGDDDSGINIRSLLMRIIALNDPDNPDDDDTTWFDWNEMRIAPHGGVEVAMRSFEVVLGRDEMPGLEEGLNEINIFGADEDENEGGEDWGFFFDDSDPDAPMLGGLQRDEQETDYVNTSEVTVVGSTGEDSPEYEEGYDNVPVARVYRNDSLAVEMEVDYNSDFEVPNVVLVEEWNMIYVTIVDGGGNESEHSDTLNLYLDLINPAIEDFTAVNGEHLATGTPEFTAILTDVGCGIDPDNIFLTIGEVDVPALFDAENDLMTAQVIGEDELGNGDYIAQLIVFDLSGNSDTTEYEFDIDLDPVDPPVITSFVTYTGSNQIILTGEGVVGTTIAVFLNDEEIDEGVSLTDSASFEFEYTAESLPDTSYVELIARNPALTESEHTEAQMLIVDAAPPEFSDMEPDDGVTVDEASFDEIRVFISDLISGVEPDSIIFQLDENPFDFEIVATDSGQWLTADVSGEEYSDGQTVEAFVETYDNSIPPNQGQWLWEFVVNINDAPVVVLSDTSFAEDEQLTIDLQAVVEDEDNSFDDLVITAEIIEGGENAEVSIDEEESLLHVLPDGNWFGQLRVVVTATDVSELVGADTIYVDVDPINDAPVFLYVPGDTTALVDEEFVMQVTAEDVDPDDELTFSDNSDLFDISSGGSVSFTPDNEMLGHHVIEFYVEDDSSAADTVEAHLYIFAPNQDIEIVSQIGDIFIDEDAEEFGIADLDTVFNDPEEADINYTVEYDQDGVLIDIDPGTNIATLSPDPDFFGVVEVTITGDDLEGSQVADVFLVEVAEVNDPPRQVGLLPDQFLADEDDGRIVIAALDSVFIDVEDNDLIFDLIDGEHLGVDIDENLILSITVDEDWYGIESFSLTVDDGVEGGRDRMARTIRHRGTPPRRDETTLIEIEVEIAGVNDAPRAFVDDPYIIDMEEDQEPLQIETPIADLFFDPDTGDQFEVSWDALGGPIALSLDETEEYLIATIVEENFNGYYEYPLTATDTSDAEGSLTLRFNVAAVNDPPEVANQIPDLEIEEDNAPRLIEIADLDTVFTDIDEDVLAYDFGEIPGELNMAIDGDNVLSITPDDNFNIAGGAEISIIADDEQGGQLSAIFHRPAERDSEPVRITRTLRNVGRGSFGIGSNSPRRDDTVNDLFNITITPVNDAPFWEAIDDQGGGEGDLIEFIVTADDVDLLYEGDNLTVTMIADDGTVDHGAQFQDNGDGTGTYTWQTDNEDEGVYSLQFRVVDDADAADQMSVGLTIGNINRAPTWDNVPVNVNVNEAEQLQFTVVGSDPDGNDLTIEMTTENLPEGWNFTDNNDGTGSFSWTPSYDDAGDYTARFVLSDGALNDEATVNISVTNTNRAPQWDDYPESPGIPENQLLEFTVTGSDPDGDDLNIVMTSEDLPEAANFTDNADGSGLFEWTPTFDDADVYAVTFTISDTELNDQIVVEITVGDVNRSPQWDNVPENVGVSEGAELSFDVIGSDPDGDHVTIEYSSENLPEAVEFTDFDNGTGRFIWTPGNEEAGDYSATFTISDGNLNSIAEVLISVGDVNRPPVWDEIPDNVEVNEGEELTFQMSASDPDGDNLTINATSEDMPDGWDLADIGNGNGVFSWTPGFDDSGNYTIRFTVSDLEYGIGHDVAVTVNHVNRTPVWDDIPEWYDGEEDALIEFLIVGHDSDGDGLTIVAASEDLPEGWSFEDNGDGTGMFNWMPTYVDAGEYSVSFDLSDGELVATADVPIIVSNVNRAPVIDDLNENNTFLAGEGDLVEFDLHAADPDGDEFGFAWNNDALPEAAGFVDNQDGTGSFSWETGFGDEGEYRPIFTASDGDLIGELEVIIVIGDVNRRPVWLDVPDGVEGYEDAVVEFTVIGEDPEGNDVSITYSSEDLPEVVEFADNNDGSGTFTWNTTFDDAGEYSALFEMSDGELTTEIDVTIVVLNVNREPYWVDVLNKKCVYVEDYIEFTLTAEDPDADNLMLTLEDDAGVINLGAEFADNGDNSGTFIWQTGFDDLGEYMLTFSLSDEEGAEIELMVNIFIAGLPIIRVEPAGIDFGEVAVNVGSSETIRVTNDGNAPLTITGVATDNQAFRTDLEVNAEECDWVFERTNESHSFLITAATLNGWDLKEGDWVGVFTPNDLCAGIRIIEDFGVQFGLAAMGDVGETQDVIEGFRNNEEFTFRIYDVTSGRVIDAEPNFLAGPQVFEYRGFSILTLTAEAEGLYENLIAAGESIEANVYFMPDNIGDFNSGLTIISSDRDNQATVVDLHGIGINSPPEVVNSITDVEIDEDSGLSEVGNLDEVFLDPNGDDLAYSVNGAEELNLNITEENILTLEPSENFYGADLEVTVTANDGRDIDQNPTGSDVFLVNVVSVNDMPVIEDEQGEPLANEINAQVDENAELTLLFMASDIEDQDGNLRWSLVDEGGLPMGWEFVDNEDGTAGFNWTPDFDAGREEPYTPLFRVTDSDNGTDDLTVNINVINVNRQPVWDGPNPEEPVVGRENEEISFQIAAHDPDGDRITIESSSDNLPEGWEFNDNGDGTGIFNWTPGFEDSGEYLATFTVSDGELAIQVDITITVLHVNRAPIWDQFSDLVEVNENEELTFAFEGYDPDNDELSIRGTSEDLPEGWEVTDNGGGRGEFNWTPTYNDAGEYTLTLILSDGNIEVEHNVTVVVYHVNRRPEFVIIPDDAEINEGALAEFEVLAEDPDGDDLTLEAASDNLPDGWEFVDNENGTGSFAWTPGYEDAGEYTVTFTVSDGELVDEYGWLILVVDVNRAPVWDEPDPDEPIMGDEDAEVAFDVRAHDPDGDDVTIDMTELGGLPEEADFTDNDDGTGHFSWQTDFDDEGIYTPVFTVSDGDLSIDVELTIGIGDVNLEPVWDEPDPDQTIRGNENAEIAFDVRAHDPNDDNISIVMSDAGGLPEAADFTDNIDGSGRFEWQTTYEDEGVYQPVFTVSDEELDVEVTLTIEVMNVNRPPEVVQQIEDVEIDEDSGEFEIADLDNVFEDPDGDELTYDILEGINELNLNIDVETNILTLEPAQDYFGESEVVVIADDGQDEMRMAVAVRFTGMNSVADDNIRSIRRVGIYDDQGVRRDESETTSFSVNIVSVNDLPVIVDEEGEPLADLIDVEIAEDAELIIVFYSTDIEDEAGDLGWSMADAGGMPDGWEFNDNQDGTAEFRWTPDYETGSEEPYTPLIRVTDTDEGVDELIININVLNVNRPPEWEDFPGFEVNEGEDLQFAVSAWDPDGDDVTLAAYSDDLPEGWEFVDNENGTGSFNWRPTFDDAGEYFITFVVSDDEFEVETRHWIGVNNVNRAPIWDDVPEQAEVWEGEQLQFRVTASDPDGDNVTLVASSEDLPEGWDFVDNDNGTGDFDWTPGFDDEGEYTLTLTVSDAEFDVAVDVTILTRDENRPPVWVDIPEFVAGDEGEEIIFTVTGEDPDGDDISIAFASDDLPDAVEFVDNDNGTGTFTWTPTYDEAGEYSAIFTLSDDEFNVMTGVSITVNNVNRVPVWDDYPVAVEVNEDILLEFTIFGSDPDGDDLVINAASEDLPEGWEFTDNLDGTGDFSWTPTYDDAGDYTATFSLSDDEFNVEGSVSISVIHVNRAPELFDLLSPQDGFEVDPENYAVTMSWSESGDADGDDVTYTLYLNAVYDVIDSTVTWENLAATEFAIEHIDSLLLDMGIPVLEEDIRVNVTWWVEASDGEETVESSQRWTIIVPVPASAPLDDGGMPVEYSLSPVYPNPFNPSTNVNFALPRPSDVRLTVWDVSGRMLEVIVSGNLPAGYHTVTWTADNLPTGVYIFTMEAGGIRMVTKGMLIR
ncbi:tandem-95 repeat protein [bacterium]|nr:tandem-95 repeat protein [bacterium]